MGLLIENLAASHLHALSYQNLVKVYYWRDGGDEVDLIYDDPEQPLAFEIGMSGSHPRSGLRALIERHPRFAGNCYVVAQQSLPISPQDSQDGIGVIPLDLFLLAVSAQTETALQNRLSFGHAIEGPITSLNKTLEPTSPLNKTPPLPGFDP
jgi:hypothetical protein